MCNLNQIKELISEEELFAILCIPISRASLDDKLVWPMEKRGELSVKSAYHFVQEDKEMSSSSKPSSSHEVEKKTSSDI